MKNKIIFILILILSFISIPVYASEITIEEFTAAYEEYVINSWSKYGRTATVSIGDTSDIETALQEYDNFSIFYRTGDSNLGTTLYFYTFFYNDDIKLFFDSSNYFLYYKSDNKATSKYYYNSRGSTFVGDTSVSVSIQGSISNRTISWSELSSAYYFVPTIDGMWNISDNLENYEVATTADIYTGFSCSTVKYIANVGDIGPTFPEIIINSSSYTESNSDIPVTIFANNYYDAISGGTPVDLDYYLRLTVYDLNGLEHYYRNFYQDFDGLYNNGNIFSAENYSSASDSWYLDFKEYFDFIFSNNLKYKLSLIDYDGNILDETDFFKVNFSDDFNPSSGSSYDITPTITALPLSASAQKTVTITSPVDNAVIYYKLDSDNPWQFYSDPVTVTENCRVYALLYGIDGSSATAQLDITNIADMTNFENRPNISPKINSRVEERNGDFYALFYIPSEFLEEYDISEWKLQWNINNSYWSDYPSGYDDRKGSARYYYEFTPEFPSVFSFRFVDKNGFYSPSCTFTLNKNSNIPIVVGGTKGDAYDSNGNYDESKTDNNSMPSFIANAETPGEYVAAGTVYIVNLFSNIGGFFDLVSSLFSFLPPIIIQILMTFLYVTFAIFVITIIKGIL